jgi:hypothetical protein
VCVSKGVRLCAPSGVTPGSVSPGRQSEDGKWNKFGGRLSWGPSAICCNNPAFGGTGNHKTGEDYTAAPNIDHTQERIRNDIKAWLKYLRRNVGFDGWRFDYVKGYGALGPEALRQQNSRRAQHTKCTHCMHVLLCLPGSGKGLAARHAEIGWDSEAQGVWKSVSSRPPHPPVAPDGRVCMHRLVSPRRWPVCA